MFQESSISQTEWLILIQKKGVAQFSLGPEVGKTESPRTATKDDWLKKKKKNQKKQGLGWYEAAENYVSMF